MVRKVDKEKYSAEAKELLIKDLDQFVSRAVSLLEDGMDAVSARKKISGDFRKHMRRILFRKVCRERIVTPGSRYVYCPATGMFRSRETNVEMRDVPSSLVDIEKVLQDYQLAVDSIMVDAGKKMLEKKILEIAEKENPVQ